MNGGEIILADEPTGALDTHTGQEVLRILEELNAAGHTIILVTHDMNVARHAQRIIEISDGEIVSDRRNPDAPRREAEREAPAAMPRRPGWQAYLDRCGEALRMALLAMNAHRLRTSLTMLGIIIGIAAVVSVVALGEVRGARSWTTSPRSAPTPSRSSPARTSATRRRRRSIPCCRRTPMRWRARATSTA